MQYRVIFQEALKYHNMYKLEHATYSNITRGNEYITICKSKIMYHRVISQEEIRFFDTKLLYN